MPATTAAVLSLGAVPASAQSCPNAGNVGFSPSLPDCRAYEMVSPVVKNGAPAGAVVSQRVVDYTLARADGDAVFYGAEGGFNDFGATDSGFQWFSVSTRSASGWSTRGVLPSENQAVTGAATPTFTNVLASSDLSQLAMGSYVSFAGTPANALDLLSGEGSMSWLSDPTISDPVTPSSALPPVIAGASSNLGAIYFAYNGTLLPSDDAGNPAFGGASRKSLIAGGNASNYGFYEWTPSGGLSYAGVLPDGSVDPYGAQPAANPIRGGNADPDVFNNNEVSSDGSRAFFVSPSPLAVPHAPASDPVELYVRETQPDGSQRTVLVSRSAVTGQPAVDSPLEVPELQASSPYPPSPSSPDSPEPYMYASPDGSHVFFEDVDALTTSAPNDGSVKEYVFDTNSNTLSYLPGVDDQQQSSDTAGAFCGIRYCYSPILTSTTDGSEFLFAKETAGGDSIDLWTAGQITQIAHFPDGGAGVNGALYSFLDGRVSSDGGVIVFETSSPIYTTAPGEFNNAGGYQQIYRYVVSTGQLTCLSCGPTGLQHSGDANMSNDANLGGLGLSRDFFGVTDSRGISSDGERVFFDSPDPLVPQAANGKRDVYEWEADGDGSCQSSADEGGCLFLISTGQSTDDSYFLDNSANGDDVFFATTEGLDPRDTDGSYDIYDARVNGGFPSPPAAASCLGDACQGAAAAAPAQPVAATVSFAGPADQTSPPAAKVNAKVTVGRVVRAGARVTVVVRVPGKGRITVSGSDVNSAGETVGKAGTYRLTVSLRGRSRATLKRKRSLRLALRVRYVSVAGQSAATSVSMRLKAQG